ncbi:MAG TPA: tetratricopeptide repeat protein [Pyrinomonadaceae bacterium]|jgi:TolA-binding protein|nr:tetratricopeptide repeat protein [Pyrinomonadaceae bacterium]
MFRPVLYSVMLAIVICSASALVYGQRVPRPTSVQLQVHGQIRYAQDGRPAEFILVRLESFRGGLVAETTTDRNGRFTFIGIASELYIVSVRVPGFNEIQEQVDLRTQVSDYVQLQLVAEVRNVRVQPAAKRPAVVDANVPQAARTEFEKGRHAVLEEKNLDKGILRLENATRLYPQYLEALFLLGTAYMDKQDWAKAEAALHQVIARDAKATTAYFALGELYLRQKKYPEAETNIISGIHLEPKSVQGHFLLGRLYYELGDLPKAGPQVGTALQLDPKFAPGHLLAANILLRARQTENALVEFEEYIRLEPKGEFAQQARQTVARLKHQSP